jgi:hypothetical protein
MSRAENTSSREKSKENLGTTAIEIVIEMKVVGIETDFATGTEGWIGIGTLIAVRTGTIEEAMVGVAEMEAEIWIMIEMKIVAGIAAIENVAAVEVGAMIEIEAGEVIMLVTVGMIKIKTEKVTGMQTGTETVIGKGIGTMIGGEKTADNCEAIKATATRREINIEVPQELFLVEMVVVTVEIAVVVKEVLNEVEERRRLAVALAPITMSGRHLHVCPPPPSPPLSPLDTETETEEEWE